MKKLDDISKINYNIHAKVIDDFKKAIPYDLSPKHQVIATLLGTYGSRIELIALQNRGLYSIEIYKVIELYYKIAADLQPDNKSFQPPFMWWVLEMKVHMYVSYKGVESVINAFLPPLSDLLLQ